jgi:hypothetical protein
MQKREKMGKTTEGLGVSFLQRPSFAGKSRQNRSFLYNMYKERREKGLKFSEMTAK